MRKRFSRRQFIELSALSTIYTRVGFSAQNPSSPTNLRLAPGLLQPTDMTYLGSFTAAKNQWEYGDIGLAYNAANNSLFMGSAINEIGEIRIPTPNASSDYSSLPDATVIQSSHEPSEGRWNEVPDVGVINPKIKGLLIFNNVLYISYCAQYGANDGRSHLARPLTLNTTGQVRGFYHVKNGTMTNGWTGGAMCAIPAEWQSALGGKALTGMNGLSLVTRTGGTSFGPCAFCFNPDNMTGPDGTVITANILLGYPFEHPNLDYDQDGYGGAQDVIHQHWSQAMGAKGIVFPGGGSCRSILFIGSGSPGYYYYGTPTNDKLLVGTKSWEGFIYRYDPVHSGESHENLSWPYRHKVWAYDAADFAAVKAGKKNYYDVLPYAEWYLPIAPWVRNSDLVVGRVKGATFDPASRRIYVAVDDSDQGFGSTSAVLVYKIP
jgi:hypothetical protein